ncbi:MAG: hypothetical protein U0931_27340 [Vulcanimicrobiota bacterium]
MPKHLLPSSYRTLLWGALLASALSVSARTMPMANCLRLLESPKTRYQAMESLQEWVYSCEDEKARGRCRSLLLAWLKQERDPRRRAEVGGLLARFLASETTPTADFEKCFEFLTDSDPELAHSMWVEFGQQASLHAMTPGLCSRLLALTEDSRPQVRLQAVSWAHEAARQQGVHGQRLPRSFQEQALKLMQAHLQDSDGQVRNEALYGCLALSELDPKGTQALVQTLLRDASPTNRSLILDFLEQHPIPELAPELEKRLSELTVDSSQHFPSPEDDLHPPGQAPEEPEAYRVVRSLFRVGPLSPAAWNYLETRGLKKLDPNALLAFVAGSGPEAAPLAEQLLARFPAETLPDVLMSWAELGVSASQLELLQSVLEKQSSGELEGQIRKTGLLAVLANSPSHPRSVALATAALADKAPEVKAVAIYALSKLDPKGPGGKAATEALQRFKIGQSLLGVEYLVVACDRLGVIPAELAGNPLLQPQQPAPDPRWLNGFGDHASPNFGIVIDMLRLQLRWLEAHPAQARKALPRLRRLTCSGDSRVVAAVRATLAKLEAP